MVTVKTVVLAGDLDTKAREYAFFKNLIEKQGQKPGFNMDRLRDAWKGMAEIH